MTKEARISPTRACPAIALATEEEGRVRGKKRQIRKDLFLIGDFYLKKASEKCYLLLFLVIKDPT